MDTVTSFPTINPQRNGHLMSKCTQLIVSSKMIGNKRKVSKSQVEVDADKAMIDVQKKLLDSKELQAVVALNGKLAKYLHGVCLPSDLKDGMYLIPWDLVPQVETRLEEFKAEREQLIEEFIAVYPSLIEESSIRLRSVFRQGDYPTPDSVRNCFSLSWFYSSFATPAEMKDKVSSEFYEKQAAKLEEKFRSTEECITAALCEAFSELVNKIVAKTSGSEDGKKKIFRDSLVTNMTEFFETFTPRNIANGENSEKLAELVNKGKKLLRGLDADDLRRKQALRDSVNLGFSKIKNQLDEMLENAPSRRITFAEDEDAA